MQGWLPNSSSYTESYQPCVELMSNPGNASKWTLLTDSEAVSIYHYRAERLGEYFTVSKNTNRMKNKPMSYVIDAIASILMEDPDPESDDDPAYQAKSQSPNDLNEARELVAALQLPPVVEMVARKKGNKSN